MATRVQFRRGTAAQWTAANPVLALGEPGVETDTLKLKIGNGSAAWSALAYLTGVGLVGDASSSSKGVVQLAGALGGTAAAPTALGLASSTELVEFIQDTVAAFIVPAGGLSKSYDDTAGQLILTATASSGGGTTPTTTPGFGDSFGTAFGGPA